MTSQKLEAEDNSGLVVYSGDWSLIKDSNARGGTLHRSSNTGDYASLSFTGVVVNIIGSLPACKTPTTSTYSVYLKSASDASLSSLGAQVVQSAQIQCTGPAQYQLALFRSNLLNSEQHMITLMNSQNTPLDLDFFAYGTNTTGQAAVTSQTTSATDGVTSTPGKAASTPSLTTDGSTSSVSNTSHSESGSSSSRTVSSTGSSSTGPVTSIETIMALTTINGVVTSFPVVSTSTGVGGSNGPNNPSGGSSKPSASPIIGGVVAGILVVFILLLLLRCRRRARTRRNATTAPTMFETADAAQTEPSSTMRSLPVNSSHIFPFPLESTLLEKSSHYPNSSLPSRNYSGQGSSGGSSASPERPSHDVKDPLFSSSSFHSTPTNQTPPSSNSSPPLVTPNRPLSSIPPSEAAPAYNPDANSRSQYQSGLSTLTNARLSVPLTLDVPPSYESVRNVADSPVAPISPPGPQNVSPTIVEDGYS